jgi:hypothetical protein
MIGCIVEGLNLRNVTQTLQNVPFLFLYLSCTKLKKRAHTAEYKEAMGYKFVLTLSVLLGLIPAMIAYYKGHNFWKWWMFGTGLFVAALPMVILLKPVQDQETPVDANGMKKCICCAELIRADAIVCQFCGHSLLVSSSLAEPEGTTSFLDFFRPENIQMDVMLQGVILMAIVFLIFAMTLLMLSNLHY